MEKVCDTCDILFVMNNIAKWRCIVIVNSLTIWKLRLLSDSGPVLKYSDCDNDRVYVLIT